MFTMNFASVAVMLGKTYPVLSIRPSILDGVVNYPMIFLM